MRQGERDGEGENIKGYSQSPNTSESTLDWGAGLVLTHEIVMTLETLPLEGKHETLVQDLSFLSKTRLYPIVHDKEKEVNVFCDIFRGTRK